MHTTPPYELFTPSSVCNITHTIGEPIITFCALAVNHAQCTRFYDAIQFTSLGLCFRNELLHVQCVGTPTGSYPLTRTIHLGVSTREIYLIQLREGSTALIVGKPSEHIGARARAFVRTYTARQSTGFI